MDDEIVSLADKIISILKQNKIIELSELAKQVGAEEHEVQNIIEILEKEEMVDVGYSLTKVLISWNDEADRVLMKMKRNQKITALSSSKEIADLKKNGKKNSSATSSPEYEIKSSQEKTPTSNKEDDSINDNSKILSKKESDEIKRELAIIQYQLENAKKKKISHSVNKKAKGESRESTHKLGAFAVKEQEIDENDEDSSEEIPESLILSSKAEGILKKSKQKIYEKERSSKENSANAKQTNKTDDEEIDKEIKQIEKILLLRLGEDSVLDGDSHIIDLDESDIVKNVKQENVLKSKSNSRRKILKEYLADESALNRYEDNAINSQIKKHNIHQKKELEKVDSVDEELLRLENLLNQIINKKAELIELNKERAILFETKHPDLKSKINAELKAINELESERESKIAKLQERLLNLPHVLSRIEEEVGEIKKTRDKIEEEYAAVREQIDKLRMQIYESKKDTTNELANLKSQIVEHEKEIVRVSNIYSSLKANEEQLFNLLDYFKQRITESQSNLINLEITLDEIRSKSRSIELRIEELDKGIKVLNQSFEKSLGKLNQLQSLEAKLSELQEEYSRIKGLLDSKIEEYEKEIIGLKESINLDFTNKYLQELQKITEANEQEYYSLLKNDELINKQIELKKKELTDLISEVKELQSRLKSQFKIEEREGQFGQDRTNFSTQSSTIVTGKASQIRDSNYYDNLDENSFEFREDKQIKGLLNGSNQDFFVLNSDFLEEDLDNSNNIGKLSLIKSKLNDLIKSSLKIKESISSSAFHFKEAVTNKIFELSKLVKKK